MAGAGGGAAGTDPASLSQSVNAQIAAMQK
eukprot:COSAG01_NODE_7962_length_2973_cov_7.643826_1_plen_29_part_10